MRRLNDGTGHFTTTGQSFTTCQADQVELADVTSNGTDYVRDGKLDAVLFCVDSGTLARMAGDGAGGFGAPHAGTAFLNSPSLASADHFALGAFTDYDRPPLALYRSQDGSTAASSARSTTTAPTCSAWRRAAPGPRSAARWSPSTSAVTTSRSC